ncbi:hypothetical protein KO505_03075 [Psychrosphaera sp. F3M07]|uniref:hypothetical protein n=1 Tax=Psychrosphaera sp. F3M07 TaxID=2841560 RepID=UPI001C08684E|nr:hypothetical protein [Psychrosphaera sp. F3M07]MBU2916944.1 hypothetical protein [Psychrosphaera sp. F3M07]
MNKILIIIHLVAFLFTANSFSADSYQLRLDAGANIFFGRLYEAINEPIPEYESAKLGQYLAIAVHKPISDTSSIGTRLDIQNFNDHVLLSVRAIDYQYSLSKSFTTNIFLGAARYQFRTPAYGYSAGIGMLYQPNEWGNWGLQTEFQYFDMLARDKLTAEDPTGAEYNGLDSFTYFQAISIGVNYYF